MNAPTPTRRGRKPNSLRYYQDGPPERVDLDAWRLEIADPGGILGRLTHSDLQSVARVEESRRYVCVCNWSVREDWGGVLLEDVLRLAGWQGTGEGLYLRQRSIGTPEKGVYESTIPLGDAIARRALLIDRVNGGELPLERGYPLRLIDFGLYGYKSVKGLSGLEITTTFEFGEWERKAGYELDGQIRPKRYRFCDLGKHHFIDRPGEVTEL
ncbi:molybdopterin-binding protein [Amycolatopsis sp. WAC 01416]|uniref:molybdopterin-dependent oxidoreductase n=1 Tax=Amycolatopsis sp. WAC 01416 TaxID=2203196 RepID=UPI000F77CDB0|nr:molybdopterin-dependent oxidoreductase [Amycolatopsis sp. WAC 01416]RSN22753.1 molybdopterin-binding protein [Amycolatopsis sp. WAC 01416]